MIKIKLVLALVLILVLQAGCTTVNNTFSKDVPEDIRRIFVGTWEGQYLDHEGIKVRTWIQNRSADGTYTIDFVHYTEKGVSQTMRKGKWWLKGDRFYEIALDVMEKPDVYEFEIISKNEISFKSVAKIYTFIDKRIETAEMP